MITPLLSLAGRSCRAAALAVRAAAALALVVLLASSPAVAGDAPQGPEEAPPKGPAPEAAPAPAAQAPPAQRKFSIRYEVRFPAPAPGTKTLEAWVPLPLEDALQKVEDLKVEASVPHEVTTEPEYGNRMAHVRVADPKPEEVKVSWSATITRTEDHGQTTGPVHPRFVEGDALVPLTGTAARLAEELQVKDGEATVRDRARKIYDYVLGSMTYDKKEPGWGRGDFERACSLGKGNCADYESKFGGIARSAGIPVRWTVGISLTAEHRCSSCGYHCWSNFYDGKTWTPVDSSDAARAKEPGMTDYYFGKADANRIALAIGRDVTLSPRQQGAKLHFFGGPYLEVDGKPVDVAGERKTYEYGSPSAASGLPGSDPEGRKGE